MWLDTMRIVYSPILKAKLGEKSGLKDLAPDVKDAVLPMLIVPPASDFDHEDGRVLTPGEHVRRFGPRLVEAWSKRLIAVDGCMVDDALHREAVGDQPITALFQRARNEGAVPIPTTGLSRSEEYQRAVVRILELDQRGLALRLNLADLEAPDLGENIQRLLTTLGCAAADVLLYVDLGSRSFDELEHLASLLIDRLNGLPLLHDWRAVFLSASEFPDGQALWKLKPGTSAQYRRGEWMLFEKLRERRDEMARQALFSDYGIEHPAFAPLKKGKPRPSVHLRYTRESDYYVAKANSKSGYGGMVGVCADIVANAEFSGDNFSAGDRFIARCASKAEGHGGPSGWRAAGQNHHITKVVRDLREMLGIRIALPDVVLRAEQDDLFV